MLFRPARRLSFRALLRVIVARLTPRRPPTDVADSAYLARLSDERLERDLGLLRRGERDYRPY
jgi:hypothetical protein